MFQKRCACSPHWQKMASPLESSNVQFTWEPTEGEMCREVLENKYRKKSWRTLLRNTPYLAQLETPDAHKSNYFLNVALSSSQLVWPKFYQFLIQLAFLGSVWAQDKCIFYYRRNVSDLSKLVLRWLTKMCSSIGTNRGGTYEDKNPKKTEEISCKQWPWRIRNK